MRLKIFRSVFIGEDNILTKFPANPMHVVHVVHACFALGACMLCTWCMHECARKLFWAIFFRIFRVDIVRMDARKSNTTRTKHYGNLEGLQEGSLSEACFCRDKHINTPQLSEILHGKL